MSNTKKSLEEMDVIDDFLMEQLAADEEIGSDFCRRMLSTLLQREIKRIRVISQRILPSLTPKLRGIRMDVEVEEYADAVAEKTPTALNIYDMEPHLHKDTDLPRHNRFYQAKIDSRGLKSGTRDFGKIPNLYVLTILNFDPFGYDYMMYTVRNRCLEIPEMEYEDGLYFYYFYTNGTKGGGNELHTLLQYLQDSRAENATDAATQEIHEYVTKVKVQPEVKQAYMRYEETLYYERKEAAEAATKAARIEYVLSLLEECGDVPQELKDRLAKADTGTLNRWHKLAAKVKSVDEFITKIS